MADWYYLDKRGNKIGPISTQALKVLTAQGHIALDAVIVNNNGRTLLAGEVKGLTFPTASTKSSAGAVSVIPPPVLPVPPPPPIQQDVYGLNTASSVSLPPPSQILNPSGTRAGTHSAGSDVDEKIDKKGSTRLHAAASNNDTNLIGILVQAGATIDAKDRDARTPLHSAAMAGKMEAVTALLAVGAEIDAEDHEGKTPLHVAVVAGKMKAVAALVQAGANVDTMDNDGRTLLYSAAVGGRLEAVSAILKGRTNANAEGEDDRTLLYCPRENAESEASTIIFPTGTNIGVNNNDIQQQEAFGATQDREQYGFVFQSVGNAVAAFLSLVLVIEAIAIIKRGLTIETAIVPFFIGGFAFFTLRALAIKAGRTLFQHRFFFRTFGLYFSGITVLILVGMVITFGPGIWQSAIPAVSSGASTLSDTVKEFISDNVGTLQTGNNETDSQPQMEDPPIPKNPPVSEDQPELKQSDEDEKQPEDHKPI